MYKIREYLFGTPITLYIVYRATEKAKTKTRVITVLGFIFSLYRYIIRIVQNRSTEHLTRIPGRKRTVTVINKPREKWDRR